MTYTPFEHTSINNDGYTKQDTNTITLDANQDSHLPLPENSFVTEADMLKDGADLVLKTPEGTVIVENYFSQEPPPFLVAPDGKTLTPDLVKSFARSPQEYANADLNTNDASPVGAVQEIVGEAHVIRTDGTVETIGIGTHIHQGDIIETEEDGAVNIMFIDETTFAISEDARLAIDEYVFDPATQSGTTNFSVLKGVFVFTSGLIGREDPDDVMIDTPSGSIGIRGTIIAGNVNNGEITVIEGAIVLYDFSGNTLTLSNQYETARFDEVSQTIEYVGELGADDVAENFSSVSSVSGELFSSIEDTTQEPQNNIGEEPAAATESEAGVKESIEENANASPTPTEEDTIITSDDITDSNIEDLNSAPADALASTNDTQTTQDDTTNTAAEITTSEPLATNTSDGSDTPSFHITITPFLVAENTVGAAVAKVTGNFAELTNLDLLGLSSNFYEAIRQDSNTFIIKLKSTINLDAENLHPLNIAATNGLGTATITQRIDLNIAHENDPIIQTNIADPDYFSGTNGSYTIYNMAQEFHDPEGRINNFTLSASDGRFENIAINSSGQLVIDLIDTGITDGATTFDITAHAWDGTASTKTFSYDFFATTYYSDPTTANITTGTKVSTNAETINILATNAKVYADSDFTDNTINVAVTHATVKAGAGDDTFVINDDNYILYGESGADTFIVQSGLGFIYGGDGNDNIKLDAVPASNLTGASATSTVLDGGGGYDVFVLNEGAAIDFSVIDSGIIRNIEELLTQQGATNVIDINYNDVIAMTGEANRLAINTDNLDTVNFNNTEGTTFVHGGTVTQAGEDYNLFTDGNITLLIDTEAANVTGI